MEEMHHKLVTADGQAQNTAGVVVDGGDSAAPTLPLSTHHTNIATAAAPQPSRHPHQTPQYPGLQRMDPEVQETHLREILQK